MNGHHAVLLVLLLGYSSPTSLLFISDKYRAHHGVQAFEVKPLLTLTPPFISTNISQKRFERPRLKETQLHFSSGRIKHNQQLGKFERLGIISTTDSNKKELFDDHETIDFGGDITDKTDTESIEATEESLSKRYRNRFVKLYDFSSCDPIEFQSMWDIQKDIVEGHVQRLKVEFQKKQPESQFLPLDECLIQAQLQQELGYQGYLQSIKSGDESRGCDAIIILQHQPVYTLGTASDTAFIKSVGDDIDVVRIERGGEVTYHGPGQLTVYPILDLRGYKQDIHWYMRALEEAILISLQRVGVLGATRENDVTGVWVGGKKIAALGVKVRRWVTMHGLAVNVDGRSLENFGGIVPCGLEGRDVCCINDFLDNPITVHEFAEHLKFALEDVFEIKIL
mmetsp:Transcript_22216/g.33251  ORF Transcript_22216/g.33251 Transcript_22216/m.33251 type:complete len:395 (+) Transcript_22216:115-1299(+)